MAHPLLVRIGRSPLTRAGLASFGILTLAAVAQFALPLACTAGATVCEQTNPTELELDALNTAETVTEPSAPAPQITTAAATSTPALPTATQPEQMRTVEVAALSKPTPTAQDMLISGTFAALNGQLAPVTGELSKRSVRTVAINADGTPAETAFAPPPPLTSEASDAAASVAASEPTAAASEPEPIVSEEPPAEPSAEPSSEAPAAKPAEKPATSLAYAPASGDNATVAGKGANVRSVPNVRGSEVLFALNGGEAVTIVESSKGWARIVDAKGRSGWIYGDYLRRQ